MEYGICMTCVAAEVWSKSTRIKSYLYAVHARKDTMIEQSLVLNKHHCLILLQNLNHGGLRTMTLPDIGYTAECVSSRDTAES